MWQELCSVRLRPAYGDVKAFLILGVCVCVSVCVCLFVDMSVCVCVHVCTLTGVCKFSVNNADGEGDSNVESDDSL